MAKRRNRTKAQPESKRGIVVTLVFFILATIGLGVATYYGFADKDKLVKAKKDADAALKAMEDQRDIYRFETHFVRSYLGVPLEAEQRTALAVAKSDFEANQLGPKDAERDKRLVKVKAVVDKLNGTIPWDPSSSQPMNQGKVQDLFQIIQEKQAEIDRLKAEQKALVDARDTAQKNEKLARDNHEAAKTEYETKYQALVKEKNENLAKYLKKVADTEDSFKKFNNEKFDKAIELAQQLIDLRKEKGGVEKLYRDLEDRLKRLQAAADRKKEIRPVKLKILGKIVRLSANGKRAYINLGSNDRLKSQVTFSVYALGANGKPKSEPKATVEVIDVGPNTSEVVITRMFAPSKERDYFGRRTSVDVLSRENTDPVQRGDVLINPTWNPNLKTHIAIAGIVDFIGDGANHVETFVRNLEKQNIIVDAYMDTNGRVKGPGITQKTDMLVLASAPEFGQFVQGAAKKTADEMLKTMAALQKQAKDNGLTQIKLRRFIEDVGYRVPRYAQRRAKVPGLTTP